jgi:hypothetical protein
VLARKAPASGGIPPGLISCKHLSHLKRCEVKDEDSETERPQDYKGLQRPGSYFLSLRVFRSLRPQTNADMGTDILSLLVDAVSFCIRNTRKPRKREAFFWSAATSQATAGRGTAFLGLIKSGVASDSCRTAAIHVEDMGTDILSLMLINPLPSLMDATGQAVLYQIGNFICKATTFFCNPLKIKKAFVAFHEYLRNSYGTLRCFTINL